MAAPDADAPLRQSTYAVGASGPPTRAAAAARLRAMLNEDPRYAEAVAEIASMALAPIATDQPENANSLLGVGAFGVQDGGDRPLRNRLIPADVLEIQAFIAAAERLEHPATQFHQRLAGTLRAAELRAAVDLNYSMGAEYP